MGGASSKGGRKQSNDVSVRVVEGMTIWYILTDTMDLGNSQGLGLNHSPKLRFTYVGSGALWAEMGDDNILNFDEASLVDFEPVRVVTPGNAPNYFPPLAAMPGQVGQNNYSRIAYIANAGEIYNNAPVVAAAEATEEDLNKYCDGIPTSNEAIAHKILHDKIVAICPREQTVTLSLTASWFELCSSHPVLVHGAMPLARMLPHLRVSPEPPAWRISRLGTMTASSALWNESLLSSTDAPMEISLPTCSNNRAFAIPDTVV